MLDPTIQKPLRSSRAVLALSLLSMALAACGGGGSSGNPPSTTGAAATVHGVVSSVSGGLTVNGVAFATSGAVLTSSDDPAPVTLGADDSGHHLQPGMVVTVRGTVDDHGGGRASEIEFHDQLEGEIERHGAGEIEVHGVHVSLDDSTTGVDRRGGATRPEDLPAGARVAISGVADSRGGLRASLVREREAEAEREVRAWVVAIDGSVVSLAFDPAGPVALKVDVSGISPAPALAVGQLFEVRTTGAANSAGVFTATNVHAEDSIHGQAEDEVEVEGLVTAADASGFTVAGQRVVTSAATVVQGGTLSDVVVGVALEAEGRLQADGSLLARVVKLRPAVRIEARAEGIDTPNGTFSVLGIAVDVTPSTELVGLSSLDDLSSGARVQVRGVPSASGTRVQALRIETQPGAQDDRAFLRGVVTAVTPNTGVTILGLSLDLSSAEFRSTSDTSMLAPEFFGALVTGQTVVKVRWRPYPASTASAVDEAEIDNDG